MKNNAMCLNIHLPLTTQKSGVTISKKWLLRCVCMCLDVCVCVCVCARAHTCVHACGEGERERGRRGEGQIIDKLFC